MNPAVRAAAECGLANPLPTRLRARLVATMGGG